MGSSTTRHSTKNPGKEGTESRRCFQEIIAGVKWLEWLAYFRAAFDVKGGICYENYFGFKQCCGSKIIFFGPEPRIRNPEFRIRYAKITDPGQIQSRIGPYLEIFVAVEKFVVK